MEEELGEEREGGAVLGSSVLGACGNRASPNCTVGLNLKYPLFIQLFFHSFCMSSLLLPSDGIEFLGV